MSFVSMIFGWGGGSTIGVIPLDALISESTSLESQATSYAVEEGPPVTDHIAQDSERLKLDGWVTAAEATLMGGLGRSLVGAAPAWGGSGRQKLISAKAALRKIHADRLPITITTGLDVYADFAMVRCDIDRTNDGGDRFSISAEFRKIRKVALRQADIPPEKTSGTATGKAGGTKTNGGKATGAEPTAKQGSDLSKILGRGK